MTAHTIELDDIETWPRASVDLLERHLDILVKYAAFDRGRYADHGLGVSLNELSVRPNPFEAQRSALFDELEGMVQTERLIAYHCTRLTESEVASVLRDGLVCLGEAHLRERLVRRAHEGALSADDVERLLARARANMTEWPEGRVGKIWAVSSPRALTDEQGLGNPLRYWGGEAVLSLTDEDRDKLASIGAACIVVFEVCATSVVNTSIADCMANRFLYVRNGGDEDDVCDFRIVGSVPAADVRKIIRRDEPEFEQLTNCSSWDDVLA